MRKSPIQSGFTFIEALVAIALIVVIATIIITVFHGSRNAMELDSAQESTRNILEEARNRALYTIPESSFGVRIASTTLELFEGSSYASGTVIKEIDLASGIFVSALNLDGGGTEIVYNKVTGTVDTPGTIVLESERNNATTTVQIHASGLTHTTQ